MAGQCCLYGNFGGFLVTYFTNHYNIRVLTKKASKCAGKSEAHLFVDLYLGAGLKIVFDGIFGRDDFDADFVQPRRVYSGR